MTSKQPVWCVCAAMVALLSVGNAEAQHIQSCVGTGLPKVSDGAFDCNMSDIQPQSAEFGNYFFIGYDNDGTSVTLNRVVLDFSTALNASIEARLTAADNLAGATIATESVLGNAFTANFIGMNGADQTTYLVFDFDHGPTGGTPLGSEYVGATLTATLSDGTVLTGTYSEVDLLTASTDVSGGQVCPECPEPLPYRWVIWILVLVIFVLVVLVFRWRPRQ